ncbi:MAG: restriction endonuclease subunit S [Prevotella sp.]|nr:restriction endonuclease subunit S [Prevotella sp.]
MELKKYRLGDLIEVRRGTSLKGEFYAMQGDYVRLTCGNFDYHNNCFKENTSKDNLYYVGDFKPEFLMKEGDIITPLTEQAKGLLGSTAIIPESGKYIQSQDIAKIVCKENLLDKNFAFYLISSNLVKQQLSATAQQTKIRHTSPDKIKDCTVWIPELNVQKQIGKILKNLDRKIEINRAIIHNLEAMAKQLYDYWFVQFDFPDENGKPYKSSGGKMVWCEEFKRKIPFGWDVKTIGEFAEVKKGSVITESKTSKGNIKVVAAGLDYSYLNGKSNRAPNTITISASGANAGYINFWREPIFASDCTTVRCDNDIDTILCFFNLKYFQIRLYQVATGAAQPHVYPFQVSELPELSIPERVKNSVSSIMLTYNKQIANNIHQIEQLINQRDNLLPLLMNGQVSVNYDL